MTRPVRDDGNAVLEFIVMTAILMIPLAYIVLAVFVVQGSAYGVTEATREAARAFINADSSADAYSQACIAATIALQNQVDTTLDCGDQLAIDVSCAPGVTSCNALDPGNVVRVRIDLSVGLPFLPMSVFGEPITIGLHSSHVEVVDVFRTAR